MGTWEPGWHLGSVASFACQLVEDSSCVVIVLGIRLGLRFEREIGYAKRPEGVHKALVADITVLGRHHLL